MTRPLLVRFWGTRGSLPTSINAHKIRAKVHEAISRALISGVDPAPASIDAFIDNQLGFASAATYGGNSACVEIESPTSTEFVICDAGSGLREFGVRLTKMHGATGSVTNIFLSHLHWDHVMGFPFFTPVYVPGNTIRIYGCHDSIERVMRTQHSAPFFPVPFEQLGAHIEFHTLSPGQPVEVAGLQVTAAKQRHGGDSYGFRFEHADGTVVYSTDGEHKLDAISELKSVVEFYRDADLVVFDAMFSLADAISIREDWGHSSNLVGVDLCLRAGVRHYCMFHHEPMNDDETLDRILAETRRYEEISRTSTPMRVSSAYDGLEIQI